MYRGRQQRERASALLLVLFLMAFTAPLICMMLDVSTTYTRCTNNYIQQVTALYVAEAGVHDAMNELLLDASWRDGFADKEFPSGLGHTYTVVVEDIDGTTVRVTSTAQTAAGYGKTVICTAAVN